VPTRLCPVPGLPCSWDQQQPSAVPTTHVQPDAANGVRNSGEAIARRLWVRAPSCFDLAGSTVEGLGRRAHDAVVACPRGYRPVLVRSPAPSDSRPGFPLETTVSLPNDGNGAHGDRRCQQHHHECGRSAVEFPEADRERWRLAAVLALRPPIPTAHPANAKESINGDSASAVRRSATSDGRNDGPVLCKQRHITL